MLPSIPDLLNFFICFRIDTRVVLPAIPDVLNIVYILAQALYPVFLEPERVCSIVGACKYSTDEVTCEECVSWMERLAGNMVQEDSIAERIEFLKVK